MARFAPVMPIQVARYLKDNKCLGNYHLLLAHDVLTHPAEYREIYGHLEGDPEAVVIMDNSLVELGTPMRCADLYMATKIIKPTYLVMPDVLTEAVATINAMEDFVREWDASRLGTDQKFMAVVQGKCSSDIELVLRSASLIPQCRAISVPRVMVSQFGTRQGVIDHVLRFFEVNNFKRSSVFWKGIHLLGFSDDIIDDISCARRHNVMGIDSAVPVRIGLRGMPFVLDCSDYGPRGLYWDVPSHIVEFTGKRVQENLANTTKWVGNGLPA